MDPHHLQVALAFFQSIGIAARGGDTTGGFVKGSRIEAGVIIYDADSTVSNLLHEAGHIAICPGRFRHLLTGDLDISFQDILASAAPFMGEPDAPLSRALIQMSDPEATAWAFAAGAACGLPMKIIIEDRDYQGEGAYIRLSVQHCAYVGINGLQHSGMTRSRGTNRYPEMLRWMQFD